MNSLYSMNNPYGIDQTNKNYSSNRQQLSDNDHPLFDYYHQQDSSSFHPTTRTISSHQNQFYPDNSNQFYRYDNGSSR